MNLALGAYSPSRSKTTCPQVHMPTTPPMGLVHKPCTTSRRQSALVDVQAACSAPSTHTHAKECRVCVQCNAACVSIPSLIVYNTYTSVTRSRIKNSDSFATDSYQRPGLRRRRPRKTKTLSMASDSTEAGGPVAAPLPPLAHVDRDDHPQWEVASNGPSVVSGLDVRFPALWNGIFISRRLCVCVIGLVF